MTWPATVTSDVLSGMGAKTFGVDCYDRDDEATGCAITWVAEDIIGLTGSFATIGGTTMRVPPWALNAEGCVMKVSFSYTRQAGDTGNQEWRIRETVSATTGGTVTVTPTTAWQSGEATLTIPDDTWPRTLKSFIMEARMAAGATGATHTGAMWGIGNCQFTNT